MEKLERTYTIPLRAGFRNAPKYRRAAKAMSTLILYLERHMKSSDIKIGQHLNEAVWVRGVKNPPPRVTVVATRDEKGTVRAELAGKQYKESVRPQPKESEPTTVAEKVQQALKKDEKADEPEAPAEEAVPKKAKRKEPVEGEFVEEKPKKAAPKKAAKPKADE